MNKKYYRNNIKQASNVDKPSTSTSQSNGNPVAPPRTRRSSSHNSLLSAETGPGDIQAANAISGGVQANQDLPYMTPPLLMLLPQPPQPQSNSPQQHFSGDSQDSSKYLHFCPISQSSITLFRLTLMKAHSIHICIYVDSYNIIFTVHICT